MTRIAAFLIWFLSCLPLAAMAKERVTVFAAASLRGALEEIAQAYPGDVSLSFGGSGTIARQIAAGAPADVVVLANTLWMDWLVEQGTHIIEAPQPVAANTLVLIGPKDAEPLAELNDLPARLATGRLAIGHRDAVPAGTYARQWLEAAGLWDEVKDRLAETDNVRAALAFVTRGAVPLGIVYASDAVAEPAVKVLWHAPASDHDTIAYPAAALTPVGKTFLHALTSPQAGLIFTAHGFQAVIQ